MQKRTAAIWFAALLSQLVLIGVLYSARPELFLFEFSAPIFGNNGPQVVAFFVLGIGLVILSVAFRRRFDERAAASGNTDLLTKGFVIALCLCETCSFLGFALAFAFDYQYFYVWMLIGVAATFLHFPLGRFSPAVSNKNL